MRQIPKRPLVERFMDGLMTFWMVVASMGLITGAVLLSVLAPALPFIVVLGFVYWLWWS